MSEETVVVELTTDEVLALLHAWAINEFPVSNPLGRRGGDVLMAAEEKLGAALSPESKER